MTYQRRCIVYAADRRGVAVACHSVTADEARRGWSCMSDAERRRQLVSGDLPFRGTDEKAIRR